MLACLGSFADGVAVGMLVAKYLLTNKLKCGIIDNVKMMVLRSPQRTLSMECRAGEYRSCSKWSEMNSHHYMP